MVAKSESVPQCYALRYLGNHRARPAPIPVLAEPEFEHRAETTFNSRRCTRQRRPTPTRPGSLCISHGAAVAVSRSSFDNALAPLPLPENQPAGTALRTFRDSRLISPQLTLTSRWDSLDPSPTITNVKQALRFRTVIDVNTEAGHRRTLWKRNQIRVPLLIRESAAICQTGETLSNQASISNQTKVPLAS